MADSSTALAQKAGAGDRAAFAQLLEEHYDMIYRVAYRFTGTRDSAEDAAQEVCCALVDKLKKFRGDSSFTTWLYRVVVNTCHDLRKKQGNAASLDTRYTELDGMLRAEKAEEAKKVSWLYRAIAALKPPLPETALLVLAEDLSHAEAGKILGCSESTISWRMHEVRKQLKEAAS